MLREETDGRVKGRRLTTWITCLAMTACVSHRSVESKYEKIAAQLAPGDRVEVELKDGRELTFRVTEIRQTELVGDTSTDITRGEIVTVPYADMRTLKRVDQRPLVVLGLAVSPILILFIAVIFLGGFVVPPAM